MIGLKRGTVTLSEYDKNWKRQADEKRRDLKKILGITALEILHIGSTAIKSIKSKPIIDLMIAVNNFEDITSLIPELETEGFYFRKSASTSNEMLFVCGDLKKDIRTFHIHVVLIDSNEYHNYINFKDYINANTLRRKEYEALKIKLAEMYPNDRDAYTKGKASYIEKMIDEAKTWKILGKSVTVTVDRPLGSIHPEHKNIVYSLNYGYVDGIKGGDGEWQDAYIMGPAKPVYKFTGKIIAVIKRENDNETKWVVAPVNKVYYQPDIEAAVSFMEKYFNSSYLCLYEKSCGAVVYTEKDGEPLYILIRNRSKNIGFPKGHVIKGESEKETAEREIFEETNLKVEFEDKFREFYNYSISFFIKKQAVYFLAKVISGNIKIPKDEILSFHLVNYKDALKLLSYPNERRTLKNAHNYIKSKE